MLQLINTLRSTAMLSCACWVILLLSAVLQLIKAVQKFDFRLVINWIPHKRWPVGSDKCSDRHFFCRWDRHIFSKIWIQKKGPQLKQSRSKLFSSVLGSTSLIGPQNILLKFHKMSTRYPSTQWPLAQCCLSQFSKRICSMLTCCSKVYITTILDL